MNDKMTLVRSLVIVGWVSTVSIGVNAQQPTFNRVDIKKDLDDVPVKGVRNENTVNALDVKDVATGKVVFMSPKVAGATSVVIMPNVSGVALADPPSPNTLDLDMFLDQRMKDFQGAETQVVDSSLNKMGNCISRVVQLEQGGVGRIEQCGNSKIVIDGKSFEHPEERTPKK